MKLCFWGQNPGSLVKESWSSDNWRGLKRLLECWENSVSWSGYMDKLPCENSSSCALLTCPFYICMKVKVKVAQSCPALCDPMDYTAHRILQARILERVAFPFSKGSSQPRDRTGISCIAGRFFTTWAIREDPVRMAIIKKSTNSKCERRCEIKEALLYCWLECKLVHALWKTVYISLYRDSSIWRDTI